jgi:hypothetical protein
MKEIQMADRSRAVFKRILPGGIRIGKRLVNTGETIVSNYDLLNGLPGLIFIGFEDEINKSSSTVIVNSDNSIKLIIENNNSIKREDSVSDTISDEKCLEVEKTNTSGFSKSRLEELKNVTPREWLKKKKSDIISILEEGGIDYKGVKDERISLYKFLVDNIQLM